MHRRQHQQGVLILREVSSVQTNVGLTCYGSHCPCCVVSRSRTSLGMCCIRDNKDIFRRQQQDKSQSVFDYFYEQLYSDDKRNLSCSQCKTSACCGNAETKPFSIENSKIHPESATYTPSRSSKKERQKQPGLLSKFSSNIPETKKTFDSFLNFEKYVDSKTETGEKVCGTKHEENVLSALGAPLGCFEIYLAKENLLLTEGNKERSEILKNAFGLAGYVDDCVLGRRNNVQTRKEEHFTRRKHTTSQSSENDDKSHVASPRTKRKYKSRHVSTCSDSSDQSYKTGQKHSKHRRQCQRLGRGKSGHRKCQKRLPRSRSESKSPSRSSSYSYRRSTSQSSDTSSRSFSESSRSCSPSCSSDRCCNSTFRDQSKNITSLSDRQSKNRSVRSPSIRRRYGSPCHLDKRRITSARKRPVPYTRPEPPQSRSSSSSSDSSSSWQTRSYSPQFYTQSLSRSTSPDIRQGRKKYSQSTHSHQQDHKQQTKNMASSVATSSSTCHKAGVLSKASVIKQDQILKI